MICKWPLLLILLAIFYSSSLGAGRLTGRVVRAIGNYTVQVSDSMRRTGDQKKPIRDFVASKLNLVGHRTIDRGSVLINNAEFKYSQSYSPAQYFIAGTMVVVCAMGLSMFYGKIFRISQEKLKKRSPSLYEKRGSLKNVLTTSYP